MNNDTKLLTFIIEGHNEDVEKSITYNFDIDNKYDIVYGNKELMTKVNTKYVTYIKVNNKQNMYNTVFLDDVIKFLEDNSYDIIYLSSLLEIDGKEGNFERVNYEKINNNESAIYKTPYNPNSNQIFHNIEIPWFFLKRYYGDDVA